MQLKLGAAEVLRCQSACCIENKIMITNFNHVGPIAQSGDPQNGLKVVSDHYR